ncbi:MAG: invasion associated locus B family protein [Erythrobacter sp.]
MRNLIAMKHGLILSLFVFAGTAATPLPAIARDSLGVYENWAAFRDADVPRCYAIAAPRGANEASGFASVGTWPRNGVRGQLSFRLSRAAKVNSSARLIIGDRSFDLPAFGRNAWASDKGMDAQIIAAMRSASRMTIRATAANGRRFSDRYSLEGAATAMDAAVVGCARQ